MKISKIIILCVFALGLSACGNVSLDNKTILFYGNTCPHCKELDAKFERYKVSEKFQFERKEVYDNKENANLLGTAALNCGLNSNKVGVPFLYSENKCFMGVPDIEKYVSEKTGISFEASASAKEASVSGTKP